MEYPTTLLREIVQPEKIIEKLGDGNEHLRYDVTEGGYVSKDRAVILYVRRTPYNGCLHTYDAKALQATGDWADRVAAWSGYIEGLLGLAPEAPPPDVPAVSPDFERTFPRAKTLLEMVREYQDMLVRKDYLAEQTKENNSAIEEMKDRIAQQMIDDDCPRISCGGYSFSLAQKTIYSKRSDAELADSGLDFLTVLREEGLGDIIVEKVDPRTLQSTVKAYVEENGELSEGLDAIIKAYETTDITRRKETKKIGGKK